MQIKLFYLLFIILLHHSFYGQRNKKLELARFKFERYSGGVIHFKARVGNINDTLNFILDTGSTGISLDSATVEKYKLKTRLSDTLIKGIAGQKRARYIDNLSLTIGNFKIDSFKFHVLNYGDLSPFYGEKIDGLVGYQFFKRFIVELDYDSSICILYKHGNFKYPRGHFLSSLFTNLVMDWVQFEDRKPFEQYFYLDIGAGLNLLISEKYQNDSSVFMNGRKLYYTQVAGLGGGVNMRLSLVKSVKIGKYKFRNVPTYLFDDVNNITGYPNVGGLLGNDLLMRFNTIFNYKDRIVHIRPNSYFKMAFDYGYNGLGLALDSNEQIVVDDVIPNSPADKAGLRIGDVLIAINNDLNLSFDKTKELLQSTTEPFKLIYKRDNVLDETVIKAIDIRK